MMNEMKIFPYKGIYPKLGKNVFIASGTKIIGDVEIGEDSSVWYNSVVRGDVNFIRIGSQTNVQDCSMLHVTNDTHPLIIGNGVTIGHSVKLHGCTVEDFSLVGIGAIVLDGAIIEKNSFVAAGCLVPPNYRVPTGKLVAGVPAKIIRDLTFVELEEFQKSADRYVEYSKTTIESLKYISRMEE